MWAVVHSPSSSKPLYFNPPDYYEMLFWKDWLKAGDLFVDVGASVGSYTLWAAELGAHVIAVEPDAESRRALEANVALNGYPVEIHACALGAQPGIARMTTNRGPRNAFAETGAAVRVETLDDLLAGRRASVKIDVEGAEHLVLDGAQASLSDGRIDAIQLEWDLGHSTLHLVQATLQRFGYTLHRAGPDGLRPAEDIQSVGGDLFAMPA